jgi:imidazolonepropionase-like amidohydrolase
MPTSSMSPVSGKFALENVRVFDGHRFGEPSRVLVSGGIIEDTDTSIDVRFDCQGNFLLPGMIDAHVHLHGFENLTQMARFGVTTALDMATLPSLLNSLRGQQGVTDIRSSGILATAPGSAHSRIPGLPKDALLSNAADAAAFVTNRVAEGADYIKVAADIPGPDQATLDALVVAAHEQGKLVVAHAVTSETTRMAQEAKVDVITHAPLDKPMDAREISRMLKEKRLSVPTLTMMEGIVRNGKRPGSNYAAARDTVTALYHAGVPILAGTDANAAPGVPANVPHGEGLHHELELLVDAGLTTTDALRAATELPAIYFGLEDRGVIEAGRRADLILLSEDPTKDIRATRSIQKIWIAGQEFVPPS